jgi:hypothetical protein
MLGAQITFKENPGVGLQEPVDIRRKRPETDAKKVVSTQLHCCNLSIK